MNDSRPYLPLDVIRSLAEGGVDFIVIGGTAVALHGSALLTFDTDIMYRRELANVHRLAAVLEDFDITLRGIDEDVPFKPDYRALWAASTFTLESKYGDFDVLTEAPGVTSYDDLLSRAVTMRIAGHDVRVASIDDLIAMKSATNRNKDQRAILDLVEIKRLLAAEGKS